MALIVAYALARVASSGFGELRDAVFAAVQQRAARLLALGLIVGLGAYWFGARYGQHIPTSVHALHLPEPAADTTLDVTEAENVRIYKEASPAVAVPMPGAPGAVTGVMTETVLSGSLAT